MDSVPYYLLCAFLFFLPWEGMGGIKDMPSVGRLVGLSILGAGIVAVLSGARIRALPSAFVVMILFFLWQVASVAWAFDAVAAAERCITTFSLLVFVWLIWEFAPTLDRQLMLVRSYVFGLATPVVMQLTVFRGETTAGDRFSGGGNDLNFQAELVLVGFLFCIYLIINIYRKTGRLPKLYVFLLPILAFSALLTGSRTGFLGLLVAGVCVLLILKASNWRLVLVFVGVAAGAIFILPGYVPTAALTRMIEGTNFGQEQLADRQRIWEGMLELIPQRPMLGSGAGCSSLLYAYSLGRDAEVAHNLYISIIVELGAIGLALFLLILLLLLRVILRMPKTERLLWLSLMFVWGIFSVACGSPTDKVSWLLFGMILVQGATFRQSAAWSAMRCPGQAERRAGFVQRPIH
jgi:O-antigen ligase